MNSSVKLLFVILFWLHICPIFAVPMYFFSTVYFYYTVRTFLINSPLDSNFLRKYPMIYHIQECLFSSIYSWTAPPTRPLTSGWCTTCPSASTSPPRCGCITPGFRHGIELELGNGLAGIYSSVWFGFYLSGDQTKIVEGGFAAEWSLLWYTQRTIL